MRYGLKGDCRCVRYKIYLGIRIFLVCVRWFSVISVVKFSYAVSYVNSESVAKSTETNSFQSVFPICFNRSHRIANVIKNKLFWFKSVGLIELAGFTLDTALNGVYTKVLDYTICVSNEYLRIKRIEQMLSQHCSIELCWWL